ncbi:hypothetical protein HID58_024517 [Brassica napus]|uniref:Uncharacterized protein n=1 Tax=Brassica napus TaxID=3708 RepID=A0ABQ7XGD8_BRANA|nr:hypothetical protein HID58_024517 [Brassica napus]
MKIMNSTLVFFSFFLLSLFCLSALAETSQASDGSTILFTTMGSSTFEFDIFTLPTSRRPPSPSDEHHKSLLHLIYVTERDGAPTLHYDVVHGDNKGTRVLKSRTVRATERHECKLELMKDTPVVTNEHLVYVSTHENSAADAPGIADFSPVCLRPGTGPPWLPTERKRVKVVEQGGWPRWTDESTLYFHRKKRRRLDQRVPCGLPKTGPVSTKTVTVQRVTPAGLHAFTPATKNEFVELTRLLSPKSHHFNPFLSPDSSRVGYHTCRGDKKDERTLTISSKSSKPLLRIYLSSDSTARSSLSPEGDRFAFVTFTGVFVVNKDASGLRQILPNMDSERFGIGSTRDRVHKLRSQS